MENQVRVGVGVFVINSEGKILIGRRKGSHGAGTYSLPGGHQEFGESFQSTAIRELKEETNLDVNINDVRQSFFTDDYMLLENKHYITILVVFNNFKGKVKNMEPHKLQKWEWKTWDEIKSIGDNLFIPMQNFIKKYPDFDPTKI